MEQESLYSFFMDNAFEMVMIFGKDGEIIYANKSSEQQLEYEKRLVGINISDIFPNSFTGIAKLIRDGQEIECNMQEMMAYRKNHTCFPVKTRIMKYDDVERYICMAYDVSQYKFLEKRVVQIEQEAEAALKVKSEFVANVTHELRTPVNGLQGNTKELISKEIDKEKLYILGMMERGCEDMHAIINNILDFSKLEAGKFTLEPRKFNFKSMIDYVKSNHINKITEKGLGFFITISPEVPQFIIGDELRIVQILNNLLSNACKFTTVGKISVQVVKTAQVNNRAELFFFVVDSGIGIDKADQDKLFKSFSQVDSSISRKYGGTGLGLNICKQLVELMDGNISVESEKNKGTMFSFSIWIELPQDELKEDSESVDVYTAMLKAKSIQDNDEDKLKEFGEPENIDEINKKMSKLILSVEMENWEKAEMFAEAIKQLTVTAPKEIKTAALKLKMAVQKANYEKTTEAYEMLNDMMSSV